MVIRVWFDGFFWHPRELFGIENHLYAFYDSPELMHHIHGRLADYNLRILKAVFEIIKPDMTGYAEDMLYNHGPMLTKDQIDEFIKPYCLKVNRYIKQNCVKTFSQTRRRKKRKTKRRGFVIFYAKTGDMRRRHPIIFSRTFHWKM